MRRFRVEAASEGAQVELPREEARHALRSLRLDAGAPIVVFDGKGSEFDARIVRIQSARVLVAVGAARKAAESRRYAIATAVPKGNRLDWMVEKLAELGAAEIVPVAFRRSVATVTDAKRARLERIAVAAAKQSGRATLPVVAAEIGFAALLERAGPTTRVAAPGAKITLAAAGAAESVVIGPEGGLTDEEEAALAAKGAVAVSLGPNILRIETAAVAAAATMSQF
jgi:16S rRNA (uracil1498-N3)-methyltransferase